MKIDALKSLFFPQKEFLLQILQNAAKWGLDKNILLFIQDVFHSITCPPQNPVKSRVVRHHKNHFQEIILVNCIEDIYSFLNKKLHHLQLHESQDVGNRT